MKNTSVYGEFEPLNQVLSSDAAPSYGSLRSHDFVILESCDDSRNFLYALSNYWNLYYMLRSMTLYDFARHSEISVDYKKLEN